MKTLIALLSSLLLSSSLSAENAPSAGDIERLREEIKKQDATLQALKDELEKEEVKNEGVVIISISDTGMQVEGEAVSAEDLQANLEALPDDAKVMIRVGSEVEHKQLASVMELCADSGIVNVMIASVQPEPAAEEIP